ncbi:MAG: CDP-alcohol phosphatidyltransferase family protein [Gammaproteobacteria bacterium]|jgi:phosphatidylglycerophosphate synthase
MLHAISRRTVSRGILLSGLALTSLTVMLGVVASALLGLGAAYVWRAVIGFLIATTIVSAFALKADDLRVFGAANRLTLLRVSMVALVAATLGEDPSLALSWTIVAFVTLALILDGFDGRIARRTGTSSAFGARFDMETDAALIMILSLLCWQFDKAGIWILAAGAMRYGFVLAGRVLPWMRSPLPYSRRRQAVCIWQSGLLLGVISPVFPVPTSEVLAAGTLLMLGASFAVDVRWLWLHRQSSHAAAPATR